MEKNARVQMQNLETHVTRLAKIRDCNIFCSLYNFNLNKTLTFRTSIHVHLGQVFQSRLMVISYL